MTCLPRVRSAANFQPNACYSSLAGRDCTLLLAKMAQEVGEDDRLEGLDEAELQSLREWEQYFDKKYKCVGRLLSN